jgi:hypothetical protein
MSDRVAANERRLRPFPKSDILLLVIAFIVILYYTTICRIVNPLSVIFEIILAGQVGFEPTWTLPSMVLETIRFSRLHTDP